MTDQSTPPVYKRNLNDKFNLYQEVRDIMSSFGIVAARQSYDDYFADICIKFDIETFDLLSIEYQRLFMNRYWVSQLNSLTERGINTSDERFCLVPNGDIKDWLRLFKEKIAPCAIEHGLPIDLNEKMSMH